jgi:hypothetical protein
MSDIRCGANKATAGMVEKLIVSKIQRKMNDLMNSPRPSARLGFRQQVSNVG